MPERQQRIYLAEAGANRQIIFEPPISHKDCSRLEFPTRPRPTIDRVDGGVRSIVYDVRGFEDRDEGVEEMGRTIARSLDRVQGRAVVYFSQMRPLNEIRETINHTAISSGA